MLKKVKRLIAYILSFIMIFQFQMPIVTKAAAITENVNGKVCTYDDGVVTVTGDFAGRRLLVTWYADGYGPMSFFEGAFDGRPIKKIVFRNVTFTTDYATDALFSNMRNLEEVVFENCSGGKKLKSMYLMFYNCTSIKKIDLSGFDTCEEVTNFDRMFENCVNLQYLDMGGENTNHGMIIYEDNNYRNMFANCTPQTLVAPFVCTSIIPLSGIYRMPDDHQVNYIGGRAVHKTLKLVNSNGQVDPDPDDPDPQPDKPLPYATMSGTPKVGQTLKVSITNGQDMGTITYKWYRVTGNGSTEISGATSSSYVVVQDDIKTYIKCIINGSDGTELEVGAGIVEKLEQNPPSGLGVTDATSDTASDGSITRTSNLMEYSTTADFSVRHTCGNSNTLNLAPGTYYVRYKETETKKCSSSVTVAIGSMSGTDFSGVVTISGVPRVGKTISVTGVDSNSYGTKSYQWKKIDEGGTVSNCSLATNSSYTLTSAELGYRIFCEVKTSDKSGVLDSAYTDVVGKKLRTISDGTIQVTGTSYMGAADGKIANVEKSMEYSNFSTFHDAVKCTGTTLTGLRAGVYYLRYYETDEYEASDAIVVEVPEGPKAALTGTLSISGTKKYNKTLTATLNDTNNTGTLSYVWKRGSTQVSTKNTYKLTEADIGSTLTCSVTGSMQSGTISAQITGIAKADGPDAPSGLSATAPSVKGAADGTISGVTSSMEYSKNSNFSSSTTCPSSGTITGLTAGTYYIRVKATNTVEAGGVTSVTIPQGALPSFSGTVSVSGTLKYNQTLTASYSGDAASSTLSYQWKRNGSAISGATSSSYKLQAADVGKEISVQVSSSDYDGSKTKVAGTVARADGPSAPTGLAGVKPSTKGASDGKITGVDSSMEYSTSTGFSNSTTCTSTTITGLAAGTYYVRYSRTSTTEAGAYATVKVPEGNYPAISGTVTISGSTKYNQTLTATYNAGNASSSNLTYTWKRGSTTVGTGRTYTIVASDINQTLTCIVTSSVHTGSVSATTGTIAKADGPAAPTGLAGVSPSQKGRSDGKITGVTTAMEYSTTSNFSSDVTACTSTTITGLAAGTYYVRVKATSTTKAGSVASVIVYDGQLPELTGSVSISGTLKYGQTLTANYTNGNATTSTLKYQWKRGGSVISGATSSTYKLAQADIGQTISCEVTSSAHRNSKTASTSATIAKADGPSAPTGLAGVSPSEKGKSDGKITGVTTAMEYSTSSNMSNAITCTSTTITGLAAGTYYIRVKETATTKAGSVTSVTVNDGQLPTLSGSVSISGALKYGQTLTANYTAGNATASTLKYQWKRGSSEINGATSFTYKLVQADIGQTITCVVSSTAHRSSLSVSTSGTIAKADGPAAPTGLIAYSPSEKGKSDGKITGVTTAMEYSTSSDMSNAITCTSTTIANLKAGTYYIRVKATSTTKAGSIASVTVYDGEVPSLSGSLSLSGTLKYGKTLTATYTAGNASASTLKYQWKRGDSVISGANASTYKLVQADIGQKITCVVTSSAHKNSLSVTTTSTISKADGPSAPSGLSAVKPSSKGKADGKITGVTTAMEYSTTSDFSSKTACTSTSITNLKVGTYYVRIAETATTKAGAVTTVTIPEGAVPAITGTLSISGKLQYGQTLTANYASGNASGTLKYQWKRGSTVVGTASTYKLVKEDIGQTITCVVSSSAHTGSISATTDKIGKADGPSAPTGLKSTATSVQGASDGTITGVTTKMEYSTAVDFATKTACTSDTISKLKAGTYYVRFAETSTANAGAYATVKVADGNPALSGSLSFTGTAQYGKTLTATLNGSNNSGTLSYQWKRGSSVISNATSSTYKLTQSDIGQKITCIVKSSVEIGSLSVTSSTVIKADSPSAPTGLSSVAATSKGAADGKIKGVTTAMEYASSADFANAIACESTTITGLKAGTYFVRVAETATTSEGHYATITVADGAAKLTGNVSIVGTFKYGNTIKAVPSTNNTGTLSYQWKRGSSAISGATSATYKLTAADINQKLTCVVKSSVEIGSITSSATSAISKADGPASPTGLKVTAASKQGAADGKITNVTTAMEYSTASDFSSSTKCSSTSITGLKAGVYYIRIAETSTTKAGATTSVKVADGKASLGGSLVISGTMKYGQTLKAELTNSNNTGTLSYQWKRGTTAISGATSSSYKLTKSDIGKTISCEVGSSVQTGKVSAVASGTVLKADGPAAPTGLAGAKTSKPGAADGKITGAKTTYEYSTTASFSSKTTCTSDTITGLKAGTYYVRVAETATHLAGAYATVKIAEGAAALSGTVLITGTAKYNQTLKASLSGSNNTGTLKYQWKRNGSNITDATKESYKLVKEDIGQKITCEVKSSVQTGSKVSAAVTVKKADGPAAPSSLIPVAASKQGAKDGQITGTTKSMEYATDAKFSSPIACSGTSITGLKAGTYYVRIKATATTNAGSAAIVKVADGAATLSGTVVISGSVKYGQTLKASLSGTNNTGTLSYQWKRGSSNISGATKASYKLVKEDIGQKITCVVKSSAQNGSLKATTKAVTKADAPAAPTGLKGVAATKKGAADGKITGVTTKMEYSTKSDFSKNVKACSSTKITGLKAGTYYVRLKETDTTKAGKAAKVTVADGKDIPDTKSVTEIFKDVQAGQWYVSAVQFVYDKGIMNGTSSNTFEPMTVLNRGQFVTVLYNLEGKPNMMFENKFSDVKEGDYFALPVIWASIKGITSGVGGGKFGPTQKITREQLATMLYNYAKYKKYTLIADRYALNDFLDESDVQDWALEPMRWAVTNKVMNGKITANGRLILDPSGQATRAECAQMIKNLMDYVAK